MLFNMPIAYNLIKTNFNGFPRMIKVEQKFFNDHVDDIDTCVHNEIAKLPLPNLIGKSIAVTAGSRGIPNFMETCRAVGRELRIKGALP
ncbi:MAG: hypothetical protein M0R50_11300, partial [Candidatus Cloacimonetes bacterium]|nr:hypothetical protein [Candidatus Cloacimonadota bacterium]